MKVIEISAFARCGKDTAAEYLKTELEKKGYRVLVAHFAKAVKDVCKDYFGGDDEKNEKNRSLWQQVGTGIGREYDENYWVDFVADRLLFSMGRWDYVLIPDTRFPNEIERMKERGFDVITIRINRENFESELTEEQKKHISETALIDYSFDYVVRNTTLEEFYERLSKVLEHIETAR